MMFVNNKKFWSLALAISILNLYALPGKATLQNDSNIVGRDVDMSNADDGMLVTGNELILFDSGNSNLRGLVNNNGQLSVNADVENQIAAPQAIVTDGGNTLGADLDIGTLDANDITFFTNGSGNTAMTILNGGNVGIGEAAPSATLDVDGSFQYVDGNESNGFVLTSDANGNASWQAVSASSDAFVDGGNAFGEVAELGTTDANRLEFITNSTTRFTIQDDGDIGIGVADANIIAGSVTTSLPIIPETNDTIALGSTTNRFSDVFVGPATVHIGSAAAEATLGFAVGTNALQLAAPATGEVVVNDAAADVNFRVEGATNANLIVADASADLVGIGKVPDAGVELDVTGDIANTGNITTSTGNIVATAGDITAAAGTITGLNLAGAGANITALNADNVATGTLATARGGTGVSNATGSMTFAGAVNMGANDLTFTTAGATAITLPTTGTVATLDGTETLTNKTLTSPTINTPSIAGATDIDGALTVNDSGADVDMRVEGDTEENLLFVDASTDRIGINTATPDTTLQIGAVGNVATLKYVDGNQAAGLVLTSDADGNATWTANAVANAFVQDGNSFGATATLGTNDTQRLEIETDGTTRMVVQADGDVGIGVADGDIIADSLSVDKNIVPFTTESFTLGDPTHRWDAAYIGSTIAGGGGGGGGGAVSLHIGTDAANEGVFRYVDDIGSDVLQLNLVSDDLGSVQFNNDQNNTDVAFNGVNDFNVLFVDASADSVGIGTSIPSTIFEVVGTATMDDINSSGAITASTFSGNGAAVTNLDAGNVATGTLAIARGGTGVSNTTGSMTFAGAVNMGANDLAFTTSGATTITLPTTGTVATLDGTETLTNKTLTSPTINTPSIAGATDIDGALTVNDSGADVDMRVEGDTEENLLFVDASTDRIGINTATPDTTLQIGAVGNVATFKFVDGNQAAGLVLTSDADGNATWTANAVANAFVQGGNSFGATAVVGTNDANNLEIETNGATRLTVDTTGNLTPAANDTQALGSDTLRFADVFVGPSTVHIGTAAADEGTVSYDTATNSLELSSIDTGEVVVNNDADDVDFRVEGSGNANLLFVDGGSNLVGIGKTPDAGVEFDVNGDIGLSGDLTAVGTLTAANLAGNGSQITNLDMDQADAGTLDPSFGGTGVQNNAGTLTFGAAINLGAQDLTLTTSGATNITLPTTGTLSTLDGTETLTNKTIAATTLSGNATVNSGITVDGIDLSSSVLTKQSEKIALPQSAVAQISTIDLSDLGDADNSRATKVILTSSLVAGEKSITVTLNGTTGAPESFEIEGTSIDFDAAPCNQAPVSAGTACSVPKQDFSFFIANDAVNLVNVDPFGLGTASFATKAITVEALVE